MQLSNEKILVNIELVFSRKKEKKKYIYTIKFFRLEFHIYSHLYMQRIRELCSKVNRFFSI